MIYGVKKIFVINSVEMQTQLQEASCLNVWGELSWVVPSCLELGASLVVCTRGDLLWGRVFLILFLVQAGIINYSIYGLSLNWSPQEPSSFYCNSMVSLYRYTFQVFIHNFHFEKKCPQFKHFRIFSVTAGFQAVFH